VGRKYFAKLRYPIDGNRLSTPEFLLVGKLFHLEEVETDFFVALFVSL
jgi:hypothetical protein